MIGILYTIRKLDNIPYDEKYKQAEREDVKEIISVPGLPQMRHLP